MAPQKEIIPADIKPENLIGKMIERDGVVIRVHMLRYFKYTIYVHPRDGSGYQDIGYTFTHMNDLTGVWHPTQWKFVPEEETYES